MEMSELYTHTPRITVANSLYQHVIHGRIRSLKSMLDRGVDINAKNDFGENLLIASLRIGNDFKRKKLFKFILRKGADIHFKDSRHERSVLLWICVLECEHELCIFLREAGVELDLKVKDKYGYTAIHYATQANRPSMVLALVQRCSRFHESVDIPDSHGFTPYIMARRLGHRDVASILKEEGKASPAQSDSYTFRSCREWSTYGKWERQREDRNRQSRQLVLDKINGDCKYGKRDFVRAVEGSFETDSKDSFPIASNKFDSLKTRHELQPHEVDTRYNKFRRSSNAAMSLLDMTSLDRGTLVRAFHHSEFDSSKRSEYKDVFGDINTILDMLSQQTSTSFRKTAIEPPRPVRVIDTVPEKPKVSSLAIIMGKNRNYDGKSPRSKRKMHHVKTKPSPSNKTVQVRCNNVTNKSKVNSVSPLPQIKVNNKIV